jgi:TonB-dependent receptor
MTQRNKRGAVQMKQSKLNVRQWSYCGSAILLALVANPAFADGDTTIETVVVTGSRMEATTLKKDAPNVTEVQSLQAIRALPDVTAAEALERVPGVSMESDSGEGRFINIRGLDADLNGTSYDGVRLTASNPATPQGGARAVAFDAFPSGILGGIEVVKSLTPELDAEALGGSVNILPRTMPANGSWLLDASLGTGLEPLRGTPVYQGDITAGTRFGLEDGDQRFSVIASYAYYDDQRGIDDIEEDYLNDPALPPKTFDDLQLRYYKYHRTRQGFGGGLTFDPDDDTSFFIRGIHAGYTELGFKHRLQLNGLGDDITNIAPNGTISVDTAASRVNITDSKETVANDLVEVGGHTTFGDEVVADFRGSWTRGSDHFPFSDSLTFKDPNDVALFYNNSDPRFPSFQTTDGTDLTNPANYTNFSASQGQSSNSDTEWAGKADLSVPLELGTEDGLVKFGGSLRERTRKATASSADFNDIAQSYATFSTGVNQIYYDAHYNIGPKPSFPKLAALPTGPQIVDPTAFEDDNENVYAGYGEYSGTYGALSVNGGVRVEATDATYRANTVDDSGDVLPNIANRSYTNVFPDLNLKYQVTDDVLLRAAYSTGIARPGFNQITAATNVDVANNVVSKGNPTLKPTTANAFDISAEYYMADGGIASLGLFYKAFADYIVPTVQLNVDFVTPLAPGGVLTNAEVDSFSNIGSAHAEGIELNLIQKLTFLPDPLDGFGFEGNLTVVGSSGQIRTGERHTLPQTSPFNYNAALFYEKDALNLRLAASYVSRNLFAVSSGDATDVFSQARFRLDFGGSYHITENIQWDVDVKNISDTKLEFTQTGSKNFPIQREFYGPTYTTAVRIALGN